MLRFAVAGLNKEQLAQAIKAAGGDRVSVIATSDMEAAMLVKTSQADYYLGACNTGGGAALAMAIGILGITRCATIASNGVLPDAAAIREHIDAGVVAFGVTVESIGAAATLVTQILIEQQG